MSYFVKALSGGINLNPKTTAEEILQNVAIILATKRNTVPLQRGMGLSHEYLDKPILVAQPLLISDIMTAVTEYEPRAQIVNVTFEYDAENSDKLNPVVEVNIVE